MKFKRRSEVVDAEQFDGTEKEAERLLSWIGFSAKTFPRNISEWFIEIYKARTTLRVFKGDWIVRGADGEFYNYDWHAFETTFERAD